MIATDVVLGQLMCVCTDKKNQHIKKQRLVLNSCSECHQGRPNFKVKRLNYFGKETETATAQEAKEKRNTHPSNDILEPIKMNDKRESWIGAGLGGATSVVTFFVWKAAILIHSFKILWHFGTTT